MVIAAHPSALKQARRGERPPWPLIPRLGAALRYSAVLAWLGASAVEAKCRDSRVKTLYLSGRGGNLVGEAVLVGW